MQVSLHPNAWHAKLQRFVFGKIPYENNFCPYFWLTIFCLFVVPFVATYKGFVASVIAIFKGIFYPIDKAITFVEERYCEPLARKLYTGMPPEGMARIYFNYSLGGFSRFETLTRRELRRLSLWEKYNPGRRSDLYAAARAYKQKIEEEAQRLKQERELRKHKRRLKAESRKSVYLKLIIVGKVLLGTLGLALVGVLVWGAALVAPYVYEGIVWVFEGMTWDRFKEGAVAVVGILALSIIALLVIYAIAKIIGCIRILFPSRKEPRPVAVGKFWQVVGVPFRVVGSGFGEVLEFFATFIQSVKENHCPSIRWKE